VIQWQRIEHLRFAPDRNGRSRDQGDRARNREAAWGKKAHEDPDVQTIPDRL